MSEPVICPSCGWEIDPDCCGCGTEKARHNSYEEGHAFVPMGCTCLYVDAEKHKNPDREPKKFLDCIGTTGCKACVETQQ